MLVQLCGESGTALVRKDKDHEYQCEHKQDRYHELPRWRWLQLPHLNAELATLNDTYRHDLDSKAYWLYCPAIKETTLKNETRDHCRWVMSLLCPNRTPSPLSPVNRWNERDAARCFSVDYPNRLAPDPDGSAAHFLYCHTRARLTADVWCYDGERKEVIS